MFHIIAHRGLVAWCPVLLVFTVFAGGNNDIVLCNAVPITQSTVAYVEGIERQ